MQNWRQTAQEHKSWCSIFAPETFGADEIGTTLVQDSNELVGETIKTSLGELSDVEPKRNGKIIFEVTSVHGEDAKTELLQYEMPKSERNVVLSEYGSILSLNNIETLDGYSFDGNVIVRRPARWDMHMLQESIEHIVSESTMEDMLTSLVNGSFTTREHNRAVPEVEFESLVVSDRPNGPDPSPSLDRASETDPQFPHASD